MEVIFGILSIILVAVTPCLNSLVKPDVLCAVNEYECADGACVPAHRVCDGRGDCPDRSDELLCQHGGRVNKRRRKRENSSENWGGYELHPVSFRSHADSPDPRHNSSGPQRSWNKDGSGDPVFREWRREKRQSRCSSAHWACRDGQCIDSDGKCDGLSNCADGSDESHALCRNLLCPDHLFRCTYGACVDGYGKCDNVTNCVDNSDELHPDCTPGAPAQPPGSFLCADGSRVSTTQRCDGRADCADGSDETVRACGATRCHSTHLFQCAYGACVDAGSDCDGKRDCADGSDEADDLCNRSGTPSVTTRPGAGSTRPTSPGSGHCLLPPYPANGRYSIDSVPGAAPGVRVPSASITVSCDPGFMLRENVTRLLCVGTSGWSAQMPECVPFCRLNPHRSVTYHCQVPNTQGGTVICPLRVPMGTTVIPTCNTPNYYSRSPVPYMKCLDGQFDYIHICEPECGKVTPDGDAYVIGGWTTQRGEFPWHVGIYRKDTRPYMQICGGSIVSSTLVISAAHCFYTDAEKLRPANKYAVAAGKLYRPWDEPHDQDAQKSDVSEIKIPELFRGSVTNYQQDIALVIISTPFEYKIYVRPVCLDFDARFNSDQLSVGQYGRVAGWGLTKEDGKASPILLTVSLPFIPAGQCIDESPRGFEEYISGDKFCAGYTNGTSLCKGDSGGGLVFAAKSDRLFTRYYLRGVVSTGPRNLEFTSCDSKFYTTFTMTQSFESFIRTYYNRS